MNHSAKRCCFGCTCLLCYELLYVNLNTCYRRYIYSELVYLYLKHIGYKYF